MLLARKRLTLEQMRCTVIMNEKQLRNIGAYLTYLRKKKRKWERRYLVPCSTARDSLFFTLQVTVFPPAISAVVELGTGASFLM